MVCHCLGMYQKYADAQVRMAGRIARGMGQEWHGGAMGMGRRGMVVGMHGHDACMAWHGKRQGRAWGSAGMP